MSRGLPVRNKADSELGLENHFSLQRERSFIHVWEKMRAFRHTKFKNRGPPLLLTSLSALAAGSVPGTSLGLCVHSQSPGSHHNLSVGALNLFGSRKRRRSVFWLAATTVECFLQHRRRKHCCKCDFPCEHLRRRVAT